MQVIDTLFLDAGGVLVQPGWDRVSAALADEGIAIGADALRAADPLARRDIDESAIIGATTDQTRGWEYFNRVLGHAGVQLSDATDRALATLQAYHRVENLWEEIFPDVVPALEAFRSRGLRLVVVSNSNGRLSRLFDRLDLTRRFDVILDSHEWGVEKPDPRLFHLALDKAGADAARTMHVGDLYHVDIVGARAAGLRDAVLVDGADLYNGVDCRRIRRLTELVPLLGTTTTTTTTTAASEQEGL